MSYKNCFSFLLLVFAGLFFGAGESHACSCISPQTALDAYEKAGFVVITRIVSVEKAEQANPPQQQQQHEGRVSSGEFYANGVKSTRMLVERVFKGSLKVGEEITFAQGGGADCIWTFSEENIGRQFLFYLSPQEKKPDLWRGFTCSRSGALDHVAEDLLYLNKLDKVRGKSRLAGTVEFEGNDELSVEGRRIRVTGSGQTYDLKTDHNGVYEIYDLPAGQYLLEVETPPGWKVNSYYLSRSTSFAGSGESDTPKKIPFVIEAGRHAALDIRFEIDNALSGKIYDPGGRLMKGVCLNLVPAHGEPPKHFYKADCTEEAGTFEIKKIRPGSYYLVVNQEGKISSSEPFKTFYYPNTFEREKATIITIGAGQTLEGLDIRVPLMEETITVEGRFLYSDGKPVADESVTFTAEKTSGNVEGDARARTDAQGRFSLKILKGLKGELSGGMYAYIGEFANCPKLERLIKATGRTSTDMKTPGLAVQAESDLRNVELKYSFPGCKKAKNPEEK